MKYKIYKASKYLISDKLYILLTGFLKTGKFSNIKNPKSFYDKMQWLRVNKKMLQYSDFADKYKVREYIASKIGEEYLIPLIDYYDDVKKINFDILPNKFAIKVSHGSKYNIICKDKNTINKAMVLKKLNKWMKENFYYKLREIQYKNIKPTIMFEEYLEDKTGGLTDYKFFCSNGEPKFIEVDYNRFTDMSRQFYDLDWNKLDWKCRYKNGNNELIKPKKLDEMISIAKKLSEDFQFVRVDLYYVNDMIYFGELTFTPAAGLSLYEPNEVNNYVGDLIDINEY